VVNLSPDKEAVLREAFRILKPGGEVYFSDVYSDRRIPQEVINGPDREVLWGECLSGALYWGDFMTLAKKVGFIDPRLVEDAPITIGNDKIAKLLGDIRFVSATYRLFKIPTLDAYCEDYGQAVIYKGTIPEAPSEFILDHAHSIPRGKVFLVCRNTYQMLKETRFAPHFEFIGDGKTHFGIFEGCGTSVPFSSLQKTPKSTPSGSKCC
jgi:SAM-dependent methyltransferase